MSSSSAWVVLVFAGLLEVGWSVGLKYTEGFTRPLPSALTIIAVIASLYLLAQVAKTLPIGTAYAVWVGIGATGAAILGVVLLGETLTLARALCMVMLLVSIIGLKVTSSPPPSPSTTTSATSER